MLTVIIGVVALAGGFAGGFLYRKKVSEKEISSAEEEGRRIVNEAIRNAESKKKEALLEAKEEILKSRTDYEKEEKSRRADLQRLLNEVFLGLVSGEAGDLFQHSRLALLDGADLLLFLLHYRFLCNFNICFHPS